MVEQLDRMGGRLACGGQAGVVLGHPVCVGQVDVVLGHLVCVAMAGVVASFCDLVRIVPISHLLFVLVGSHWLVRSAPVVQKSR